VQSFSIATKNLTFNERVALVSVALNLHKLVTFFICLLVVIFLRKYTSIKVEYSKAQSHYPQGQQTEAPESAPQHEQDNPAASDGPKQERDPEPDSLEDEVEHGETEPGELEPQQEHDSESEHEVEHDTESEHEVEHDTGSEPEVEHGELELQQERDPEADSPEHEVEHGEHEPGELELQQEHDSESKHEVEPDTGSEHTGPGPAEPNIESGEQELEQKPNEATTVHISENKLRHEVTLRLLPEDFVPNPKLLEAFKAFCEIDGIPSSRFQVAGSANRNFIRNAETYIKDDGTINHDNIKIAIFSLCDHSGIKNDRELLMLLHGLLNIYLGRGIDVAQFDLTLFKQAISGAKGIYDRLYSVSEDKFAEDNPLQKLTVFKQCHSTTTAALRRMLFAATFIFPIRQPDDAATCFAVAPLCEAQTMNPGRYIDNLVDAISTGSISLFKDANGELELDEYAINTKESEYRLDNACLWEERAVARFTNAIIRTVADAVMLCQEDESPCLKAVTEIKNCLSLIAGYPKELLPEIAYDTSGLFTTVQRPLQKGRGDYSFSIKIGDDTMQLSASNMSEISQKIGQALVNCKYVKNIEQFNELLNQELQKERHVNNIFGWLALLACVDYNQRGHDPSLACKALHGNALRKIKPQDLFRNIPTEQDTFSAKEVFEFLYAATRQAYLTTSKFPYQLLVCGAKHAFTMVIIDAPAIIDCIRNENSAEDALAHITSMMFPTPFLDGNWESQTRYGIMKSASTGEYVFFKQTKNGTRKEIKTDDKHTQFLTKSPSVFLQQEM
jgi:hypothetical protein